MFTHVHFYWKRFVDVGATINITSVNLHEIRIELTDVLNE